MLFPAQIKILKEIRDTTYQSYILCGSVRSGKTTTASAAIPLMMDRCKTDNFAIVGVSQATIERNVIKSMRQVLGDNNVIHHQGKQKVYCGGRTFDLIGATDDRAEGKVKGLTAAGILVDEAT